MWVAPCAVGELFVGSPILAQRALTKGGEAAGVLGGWEVMCIQHASQCQGVEMGVFACMCMHLALGGMSQGSRGLCLTCGYARLRPGGVLLAVGARAEEPGCCRVHPHTARVPGAAARPGGGSSWAPPTLLAEVAVANPRDWERQGEQSWALRYTTFRSLYHLTPCVTVPSFPPPQVHRGRSDGDGRCDLRGLLCGRLHCESPGS